MEEQKKDIVQVSCNNSVTFKSEIDQMAESFIIANHSKRQWINPSVLPARHKFPSILIGEFMQAAITLLVCTTKSIKLKEFDSKNSELTKGLLGVLG